LHQIARRAAHLHGAEQRAGFHALGYEDVSDHDELRHDPVMAVLAGKLAARRAECAPVAKQIDAQPAGAEPGQRARPWLLAAAFPARPRDRSRRRVEHDLTFHWQIVEGAGALAGMHNQTVTFLAPAEPGLTRVKVTVCQRDVVCTGEGVITVASWRSRLDAERNVIVVNNGHRDFVYASRSKSLKLRYLVRL
jgi:hypothetical protein